MTIKDLRLRLSRITSEPTFLALVVFLPLVAVLLIGLGVKSRQPSCSTCPDHPLKRLRRRRKAEGQLWNS